MLCVTLKDYVRACAPTTGGVSAVWAFDPLDWDFTKTALQNDYATLTRRAGATFVGGSKMSPITFLNEEGQFKATQKQTGCSTSWDYELTLSLPQLTQGLSDFLTSLATAACCCGLGLIIQLNDGTLLVVGERYVGGAAIPRWVMKMDGATIDSGKVFTDYNGAVLSLKGSYSRTPNTFSGGVSVIEGFVTA